MTDHYPKTIADLLAIPHPISLGPGSPNRTAGDRLRSLVGTALFDSVPIHDEEMAQACLAGLWLRFDYLDESHKLSQGIETPTGSFWHAIMHRREGDFSNSKYWWRRVGKHPALIGDPFEFVDAVKSHVVRGEGEVAVLFAHQQREWDSAFEFSFRHAIGVES
jgi:hypothetical protein